MTHLFDLDITLWDTFDKRGNSIWAKQLVAPYKVYGNMIVDDVFSKCVLRKGVREYLQYLRDENHQVGFVSVGGYFGMEHSKQPSIRALKLFGIFNYFNSIHVLEYKVFNKAKAISQIKDKVIFYDDAPKNFEAVKHLTNVTCVDSLNIKDWSQLIGKKYD